MRFFYPIRMLSWHIAVCFYFVHSEVKQMKEDNKKILEEHLKVLQNAAKKDCSGEDLKAITEAIVMVLNLLG